MPTLPLLTALLLSATPAKTTPLGVPQFADPPERNGAGVNMKPSGIIRNTGRDCHQVVKGGVWRCVATEDTVDAARQSAITAARTAAAEDMAAAVSAVDGKVTQVQSSLAAATSRVTALENGAATTAGLASAVSTLNGRIDAVQSTAGAAATQSALTAAVKPLQDADAALSSRVLALEQGSATQGTVGALTGRVTTLEGAVGSLATQAALSSAVATLTGRADTNATAIAALATRVTTLEGSYVSTSALASALAPLSARIAALEASGRVCTSATFTGLSIPIAGLSSVTTVTLAGAPVGTTCSIATNTRMPLGATPEGVVSQAGKVDVAFRGNTNLLSAVIAIPSGTYRVCCDR